ncbi:uncharacterized protein LOC143131472 [Alosa pseudoharengus]|uniref:uncharacterized protein LOC143131472 n=1 Tax=Alosa pseudoharengus TaxID=34774 RepID=UPI003F8B0C31
MGYLCPPGHSCPVGSAQEVPCEAGTYSSSPGAANCSLCPAGTACLARGMLEPVLCPLGHFCPIGTALPLPCPAGTLGQMPGALSQASCSPCPTGHYCSSPGSSQPQGMCEQGFFCQGGASRPAPQPSAETPQNGPCPAGHYCPRGTLSPVPCPTGSVRNLTGGVSVESCFFCPGGYYCDGEGLDSPSGACDAGFYCPSDSAPTTPHTFICTKGHFCPRGSPMPLPCPTGQYQPNIGSDSCIPCRPGFYCEEAVVGDPLPCPPHTFCPAATMVPQPCPDGTFTHPHQGGLRDERECLPCPPGKYCRAGQIKGVCAAGYVCVSSSSDFSPQGHVLAQANRSVCKWGVQCAGPCPAGFFCAEGTEHAQPCPANTVRSSPGASSLSDCLPCPPAHWCKEGDPVLHDCPEGHYCDGIADSESGSRPGPRKCPAFTYRDTPGAGGKGDCHPCPPGTFCNSTGLTDYLGSPCPPGFWCSGSGQPVLCPGGTFRTLPGAADANQCAPCIPGTYCPDPRATGMPNTAGIPCRASYQCPEGSALETPCEAGYYCGPQTGEPSPCPLGYECPEGSHTYSSPQQLCPFPFFCPAVSSSRLSCPGGFMPVNSTGLRGSLERCCVPCEAGTYRPALSSILHCQPCPPGYHCPAGAESHSAHPCPSGLFCPPGSASPLPCPPGSYGNRTNTEAIEDCHACPQGTFNHMAGQTACFPCGSSATSSQGSSTCTCIGRNRAFQPSDGSCLCRTGFVFYNQLDLKSSSADSPLDCQPEVSKRCGWGEVRLASSQECVKPSEYSCDVTCGAHGGRLDVDMGICHCERYVSSEELCDAACSSQLPLISARRSTDGHLLLGVRAPEDTHSWNRKLGSVVGPDSHVQDIGKIHFVQFDSDGVFGWILKDPRLIDRMLKEPVETLGSVPRRKRSYEEDDEEHYDDGDDDHVTKMVLLDRPPRIPNPIACLSSTDMLIFHLHINHTDRLNSHFPVYQKDHLFNSNPSWDYGAFRRLQYLMTRTQFNSSRFAHVFPESGTYVFVDNAVPEWSLVVVVSEDGSACDPNVPPFQPSSPAQLVRHGVVRRPHFNLLPDWGAIAGILVTLLVLVVVVTGTTLLLKPHRHHLVSHGNPKPRWRSLGQPPAPLEYVYNGESLDAPSALGLRGVGEGAEAEETAIWRGGCKAVGMELEEFNVKTLYDKLEDQNLHVASQLAKHRKDTQEFYRNICHQTNTLRDTLENMGPEKLSQLKEIMQLNSKQHNILCSGTGMGQDEGFISKNSLQVMEALLPSVETLLYRLCGESWQQMEATAPCLRDTRHTPCRRDTRQRELQTGYTPFSSTDLTELKTGRETESAGPTQCSRVSVSDQELSRLVALTPLSRTIQEIQESLQSLPRSQEVSEDASAPPLAYDLSAPPLVPVPLDSLSPHHFSIFLFGCQLLRLLRTMQGFPQVLLLLAQSMPTAACHTDSTLAYCCRDFYYDTDNQILYLLESKLQDVGQFVCVLLHSMAYISSGCQGARPRDFMEAFHKALSALGLQLFTLSFTLEHSKEKDESTRSFRGTVVEDFLSVKLSPDTHLSPRLLQERLQKYKYFKLEHLLNELCPARQPDELSPSAGAVRSHGAPPTQVLCMEQEIKRHNEVYLQLDTQLLNRVAHTQRSSGPHTHTLSQAPSEAAEARERTLLLGLRQHSVAKRLQEMRERLSRITPQTAVASEKIHHAQHTPHSSLVTESTHTADTHTKSQELRSESDRSVSQQKAESQKDTAKPIV